MNPTRLIRSLRKTLLYLLLGVLSLIGVLRWSALPTAIASEPAPILSSQSVASNPSALAEQGQMHYAAGDYEAAVQAWQRAIALFSTAEKPLEQARILSHVSLAYQQLGLWDEADASLTQGVALLEGLGEKFSEEQQAVWGQIWAARGTLALAHSRSEEAIEAFETAEAFYEAANDTAGVLRSQINQARALQAGGYYRRALALLEGVQPPLQEQMPSLVTVAGLRTLGDLNRTAGNLTSAQVALEQSLNLAQQLGDRGAIATTQLSLANVAAATGQTELALSQYEQIAADRVSLELTVQSRAAQLDLLLMQGEQPQAEAVLAQLELDLAALPPGRLRNYAYIDVANSLVETKDPAYRQTAAAFLAKATQDARNLGDLRAESYAMGSLGQLYQDAQQFPEAQSLTEQAVMLASKANAPEVGYRWNAQLGFIKRKLGETEAAISHYTAAVNALQALRTDLVAVNSDVSFSFRETVEPVYRDLVDLLTARPEAKQADLQQARSVIESLQLAELENFFREACLAVRQDIDQIVDSTDQPTAVFYPIILPDRLEVILKLPQQPLTHYAAAVSQETLEAQLEQLRTDLVLPYTLKQVQTEAAQLYDWLIKPVASQLDDNPVDTLVFVLDGSLRNIPMGLLYDGEQYLIEKYSVAIAPGLQLVDPQQLANHKLAAITAGLSESRHGFPALQYVEDEVIQVQSSVPSQVLLNQSFTENNLENAIKDTSFPIVHLATHGQFSSNLEDTFILAWDKPIPLNNLNQLLRSSEQSRDGTIELLVLSACETATGDKRAALGLAGVAVRAGARSTLASLWSLDDETTAIMMNQFYEALQTPNITRAAALRKAQTVVLSNPRYAHPRYWAPFVLIGNWL